MIGVRYFRSLALLFRERLFLNLVHYVDESGTHDATGQLRGAEVAVVAGYVAWKDNWDIFCTQWQAALAEFGASHLHVSKLTELWRRAPDERSPYFGWDRAKALAFLRSLVPLARQNTLFGIGAGVSVRDYDSLVPARFKNEIIGHPFHFCFQLLFENLITDLSKDSRANMIPPEPVAWFCDQNDEFAPRAVTEFAALKASKDPDQRMGAIAFDDKKRLLPLQAADLLAYWSRRQLARHLGLHKAPYEEWETPLDALASPNREVHWRFHDRESLSMLVPKFIAERPDLCEENR